MYERHQKIPKISFKESQSNHSPLLVDQQYLIYHNQENQISNGKNNQQLKICRTDAVLKKLAKYLSKSASNYEYRTWDSFIIVLWWLCAVTEYFWKRNTKILNYIVPKYVGRTELKGLPLQNGWNRTRNFWHVVITSTEDREYEIF